MAAAAKTPDLNPTLMETNLPKRMSHLEDPRTQSDFQPELYPTVNGRPAPAPGATERNDRVALEFLAAYYGLNRLYARLRSLRAQPETAGFREETAAVLREIERLLVLRDQLEDTYAPFGVIAEPKVREGMTEDVVLSFGDVDAAGNLRSNLYTITACVPVPLPEGMDFDKLPIAVEGPGLQAETSLHRLVRGEDSCRS